MIKKSGLVESEWTITLSTKKLLHELGETQEEGKVSSQFYFFIVHLKVNEVSEM